MGKKGVRDSIMDEMSIRQNTEKVYREIQNEIVSGSSASIENSRGAAILYQLVWRWYDTGGSDYNKWKNERNQEMETLKRNLEATEKERDRLYARLEQAVQPQLTEKQQKRRQEMDADLHQAAMYGYDMSASNNHARMTSIDVSIVSRNTSDSISRKETDAAATKAHELLKGEKERLEAENKRLKQNMGILEQQIKDAPSFEEVNALQSQVLQLKEQKRRADENITQLNNAIAGKQAECSEKEEQLEALRKEKEDGEARAQNLQTRVNQLEAELAPFRQAEEEKWLKKQQEEERRVIPMEMRIATLTDEVDKYPAAEFMESNLSLSGRLWLTKAPPSRAHLVIIDCKAYPNPYYFRCFAQEGETLSHLEKLRYLFRFENESTDSTARYTLISVCPAKVDLSVGKEYRLLEKGCLGLKER